jgi:predicted protein tyrosine phosphatase
MNQIAKGGSAEVEWATVMKVYEKVPRENLLQKITDTILQTKNKINYSVLEKYVNAQNRENYIKSATVNLMSTPEYQLC